MNYDPYWDTIEEAPPQVQMYDPAKGQKSPVDPFDLEIQKRTQQLETLLDMRDQAKAEAEKAMTYTGRNPIEQAIVGLAPMALGALLGGKQGLGAGGIGTVAGLKAYDSYADEEAKRQQLIAAQFYKDAQANVSASQKALDALRGDQIKLDFQKQSDLEMESVRQGNRLEAIDRKGQYGSGGGLDRPVDPTVIAEIERQTGMKFPQDVSGRDVGLLVDAGNKGKERVEAKNKVKYKAEDEIYNLEAIRTNGLTYFKPPLEPKKDMAAAVAHTRILRNYDELKELYDRRRSRTQPLSDTDERKEASRAYALAADILLATKSIENLGAAFTELEAKLAKLKSGSGELDAEGVFKTISRDMLFGTSAANRAEYGREMAIENMANEFSKRGAVLNGVDYNKISPRIKEELQQRGVTWGDDGRPLVQDAIQARINQLQQRITSSSEPMGADQAATGQVQKKLPLKQFLKDNNINYKSLDSQAQIKVLMDIKRSGYSDEEIRKILGD